MAREVSSFLLLQCHRLFIASPSILCASVLNVLCMSSDVGSKVMHSSEDGEHGDKAM